MGESQEVQLRIMAAGGAKEINSLEDNCFPGQVINQSIINRKTIVYRWFRIALYTAFVLLGQSIAVLLGRLYYEKGGRSTWIGCLVQLAGFPILLPYYCIFLSPKNHTTSRLSSSDEPSTSMLAFVFISFGLIEALDCYLFSIGLLYLPVSTFSLINSSQLAFSAFFCYFLNSLKFTPYIINSVVLLTISSTLLVFQTESSSDSAQVSNKKYVIGFTCTVAATAGNALLLSFTQLAFRKVLKGETFKVVIDMVIYQSLVATFVTLVGFFASGEWNGLKKEFEGYEMGKVSYVLNLTFTAMLWPLFNIGTKALIFEASSLFSNAIDVLSVPFAPILAVIFFQDRMQGIKVISMVLGVWGFVSYVYQQYLDDYKVNTVNIHALHVPKASSPS